MDIRVALISDFYFPGVGGVEMHLLQLAKWLDNRVNRVVVITHAEGNYFGARQVEGITTYYLPWPLLSGVALPTFLLEYPEAHSILSSEAINLVHLHQSSSGIAANYGLFAYHMGIRVIHTQHSLYEMNGAVDLLFNWIIQSTFLLYHRVICVSRTTRNNLLLRTRFPSQLTYVIPNAVSTKPQPITQTTHRPIIKLVTVNRMTYRRGIDLLIELLPTLLQRNPALRIQIVGDGQKLPPLMKAVEQSGVRNRVTFYGRLSHVDVLAVVSQCDIYLSVALTESFGMALVEAASLGLHCISTRVGGTSEIMMQEHLKLVEATPNRIIEQVELTIKDIEKGVWPPPNVKPYYPKEQCFQRVLEVYQEVTKEPTKQAFRPILGRVLKQGSLPALLLLTILGLLFLMDVMRRFARRY